MGYVSAHDVIAVNPEMKERIENLGKYQESIISRMGLNDDTCVRTYKDPKEEKSEDPMDNNEDKKDVVQEDGSKITFYFFYKNINILTHYSSN